MAALPLTRPDIVAVPADAFGDDDGNPVADVGPAGGGVLLPQAVATTVMAIPITDFKYADRIGLPPAASGSLSVVWISDSIKDGRGPGATSYKAGASAGAERRA